ncbi:MAG: MFS transporter [Pseudomonadota bacterium]|nr:MFS transporter [Pseudomonadota bacterium]
MAEARLAEVGRDQATGDERWALALISSGHFLSHFYGLVLPPLFPLLKVEFGVSYLELGLAMTAFSLLGGVVQAPVGFLVDRLGPRRVLLVGLALISGSVLLMGFASSFGLLLVLAIFAGLGNSVFHPADYAILAGAIGEKRLGRAYSMHTFSGFLGGACAPVSMLALVALFDWRTALIATGAVGLAIFTIMAFRREVLIGEGAETMELKLSENGGIGLLFTAPVLLFLAFFTLYGMASGGLLAFTVSGLIDLHRLQLSVANTALTAHLFGVVAGILLAGIIADRYPRHIVTAALALILGTVASMIPMFGGLSDITLIAIMALAGIGLGAVLPPRDLMLRTLTPAGQTGKVFGFVFVGYSLGVSISPLMLGAFLDAGLPAMVFLTSATFALLSLFAIYAAYLSSPKDV